MGILKKARHSKIDVFVKFESAINLEISGQIKKKLDSFYLGHRDHNDNDNDNEIILFGHREKTVKC